MKKRCIRIVSSLFITLILLLPFCIIDGVRCQAFSATGKWWDKLGEP